MWHALGESQEKEGDQRGRMAVCHTSVTDTQRHNEIHPSADKKLKKYLIHTDRSTISASRTPHTTQITHKKNFIVITDDLHTWNLDRPIAVCISLGRSLIFWRAFIRSSSSLINPICTSQKWAKKASSCLHFLWRYLLRVPSCNSQHLFGPHSLSSTPSRTLRRGQYLSASDCRVSLCLEEIFPHALILHRSFMGCHTECAKQAATESDSQD